ncbi:MAG: hypothetical protein KJ927_07365 [Candidatus Eisenbacteria bacterium]|nr:hypothetical protein [Candidatus Eisenbacteria bacterium]
MLNPITRGTSISSMQGEFGTRRRGLFGIIVSALLLSLAPAPARCDVESIHNGSDPANGIRTVRLEEVWRVGGEDSEILMGVIADALARPNGEILLLDQQLCQVLVYSAEGAYLRTLGREGDGPGEVRLPRQILWTGDEALGFVHRAPGRVTRIDMEGTPLPSFELKTEDGGVPGMMQLNRAYAGDGFVVINGSEWKNEDDARQQYDFLGIFDENGVPRRRLMTETSGFNFTDRSYDETNDNTLGTSCWAVDQEGFVYYAPERDRYEIDVLDAVGNPVRTIERDYERNRRTSERKEELAKGYSMSINGEAVQLTTHFLDFDPVINWIRIDEQGRLLVSHSRSRLDLPDGIIETWDVFDREGRFQYVLQLAGEMNKDQDRLIPLVDGRFVLLRNILDAQRAMWAGYGNDDGDDKEEDLSESEPLEVVLLRAVAP